MKDILIFVAGIMTGGITATVFMCLVMVNKKRGVQEMCKRKLCPHCETGKQTYELDKRSTECPYLLCHNGNKCGMYKKMNEPKKVSILRGFIDWLGVTPPRKNEPLTAFQSLLCVFCGRRFFISFCIIFRYIKDKCREMWYNYYDEFNYTERTH